MSERLWYVANRIGWMGVTAWFILSLTFVLFAIKPDPQKWLVLFGAGPSAEAQRQALQAYRAAHNYDVPLLERYIKWMGNYATLQWGTTLEGIPIAALIGDALKETLTYLVPSLIVSTIVAYALGLYMALHRGGYVDKLGTALAYGGYGVPAFFAAELAFGVLVHEYELLWIPLDNTRAHQDTFVPMSIDQYLLPMAVLTGHLIAIQLVFIRSEVAEQLEADFMKTFRASGARVRDLARHAVRNALVPLISSFFAQILTIIYLDIIAIEVAIGPGGFGQLTFNAFTKQDLGLILGVTLVPVGVGLGGNLIQDLAYTFLDPRVEYGSTGGLGLMDRLPIIDLPRRSQVVVGVLVVLVAIGSIGAFAGLYGVGGANGEAPRANPTATPQPGLDVRIGYNGRWQLHLQVSANGTMTDRSRLGNGTEVIEINPNATMVRATVQKRDGSHTKLVLQIVYNGQLVKSASTTEEYGTAQVIAEL